MKAASVLQSRVRVCLSNGALQLSRAASNPSLCALIGCWWSRDLEFTLRTELSLDGSKRSWERGKREEGNECNGGISRRVIAVRLRPQPHQEKRFIKFSIHVYRRFNVTKILLILYLTFFLFEHSLHFMQVSFVSLNLCDISPCWQLTL